MAPELYAEMLAGALSCETCKNYLQVRGPRIMREIEARFPGQMIKRGAAFTAAIHLRHSAGLPLGRAA